MKTKTKFNYIVAILAVTILTLTACGGDDTTVYTVTFNPDNGSPVFTQKVVAGGWAICPEGPDKEYIFPITPATQPGLYVGELYYSFEEWMHNGVAFNFSTPINANITLIARYDTWGEPTTLVGTLNSPTIGITNFNTIAEAVNYIRDNPSSDRYFLLLNQNFTSQEILDFSTPYMYLTIIGIGSERTIQPANDSYLFQLNANGVRLTLGQNITLLGRSGGSDSLVLVQNGYLEMRDGSKITGHITSNANGAMQVTGNGAYFYMSGGEITGNHSTALGTAASGGVRIMDGASLYMLGGSITGNTRGNPPSAMDLVIWGASS